MPINGLISAHVMASADDNWRGNGDDVAATLWRINNIKRVTHSHHNSVMAYQQRISVIAP